MRLLRFIAIQFISPARFLCVSHFISIFRLRFVPHVLCSDALHSTPRLPVPQFNIVLYISFNFISFDSIFSFRFAPAGCCASLAADCRLGSARAAVRCLFNLFYFRFTHSTPIETIVCLRQICAFYGQAAKMECGICAGERRSGKEKYGNAK